MTPTPQRPTRPVRGSVLVVAPDPRDASLAGRALELAAVSPERRMWAMGSTPPSDLAAVLGVGRPPEGAALLRLRALFARVVPPVLVAAAADEAARCAWRVLAGARSLPVLTPAMEPVGIATALASALRRRSSQASPSHASGRRPLVVLGASTGGQPVLTRILAALPATLSATVVVCQHQPPAPATELAALLARSTALPVRTLRGGEPVDSGGVWVAPPGADCVGSEHPSGPCFEVRAAADTDHIRPSLDALLLSLPTALLARTLVAVLTGMGHDGLEGCRRALAGGARVLIQHRASCAVWGMPRSIAEAGLADAELDPEGIAREIRRFARPPTPTDDTSPRERGDLPCAP